jgi:hypothetical protein
VADHGVDRVANKTIEMSHHEGFDMLYHTYGDSDATRGLLRCVHLEFVDSLLSPRERMRSTDAAEERIALWNCPCIFWDC